MLALPLNDVPPMFLAVVSVAALPVVFWFSVGNVQLVSVPLDGVPRAPPEVSKVELLGMVVPLIVLFAVIAPEKYDVPFICSAVPDAEIGRAHV